MQRRWHLILRDDKGRSLLEMRIQEGCASECAAAALVLYKAVTDDILNNVELTVKAMPL